MRHISFVTLLALVLCLSVWAVSCGNGTPEETEAETYVEIDYGAIDFDQYIKVGQYKDLSLVMSPVSINMNIIEQAFQKIIDAETTVDTYETPVTDRVTQKGDYVEISYKAYFDGVYYAAGSSDSVSILLLEDNGFFEWLDDDLYGIMPGTTVETVGTLPNNTYYGDYAGKEGTFLITLINIKAHHNIPELSDELVAKYTDYATMDEYYAALYEPLYEAAEETLEAEKISKVWQTVLESSEVLEYPEQQVMFYYTTYRNNIMSEANLYGHTYEEHLEAIGLTDEFVMARSKDLVLEELVFYTIVEKEGFSISDEEYAEGVAQYAEDQGLSVEQLETEYGKDYIKDNLLWDKVMFALRDMTTYTFES